MKRASWAVILWVLCLVPVHAGKKLPDQAAGLSQLPGNHVPLSLSFTDEDDHPVVLSRYFYGRPVLLLLAYYHCPNLCGTTLEGLRDAVASLRLQAGRDFHVVVASIDERERPANARARKAQLSLAAPTGWHFLTGKGDAIARLTDAVGFRFSYDATRDEFAHPAALVLLTPQGRVARYLLGVPFAPADLRLGIIEAGQGKVGSVLDRLLLVCYHFDPATGRYTPAVMAAAKALGIITMSALGLLWWRLRKRSG